MQNHSHFMPRVLNSVVAAAVLFAPFAVAQTRPAAPAQLPSTAPMTDQDLASIQDQLIGLLRMSPTLTTVVAHDPSLLADQEYVSRNNPKLAQFLAGHPEIARNPEFYLFTRVDSHNGHRDQALQRAVWPEFSRAPGDSGPREAVHEIVEPIAALGAFACFLGALIWLIRQFIENRRWGRIFKLQSDVHGRLIEKFNSSQELAAYMGTEAGKRFLEAAPIPIDFEQQQRMPNAVARVLTPLQIGVVLTLLGTGLFALRGISPEMNIPMLIFGTVVLMPGLGFIISAGITWVLAGRLGLMPGGPSAPNGTPFNPQDRQ